MNIGIIIHSHTGNTLFVAEKIQERLLAAGHTVNVERVKAVDENPNSSKPVVLEEIPSLDSYDAVIVGAPVWGFSLSPVMKMYLEKAEIKDKIKGCFVTQHFSKAWLGGNRAVRQIKKACQAKGCGVNTSAVINWSNKQREEQINGAAEMFAATVYTK